MKLTRTLHTLALFAGSLAAGAFGFTAVALAQSPAGDFPSKPIRIIVPYPPGGGADLLARLIGQHLSERFGQSVVVDNRGGGSNTIGMGAVAKASPDGYTLGLATPVFVMTPSLMKDHPYDPIKDFASVGMIGSTPLVLVVHPSVPARTTTELIRLARAKPGTLNFASLGSATTQGLAGLMFGKMAGIDIVQIPYKGSAPGTSDLLAGQVQLMFNALPSMLPHVKAGKLRALGITSSKRSPFLPDVPPVAESVPGYEVTTWYGFVAPAGTPPAVIDLLNREIGVALGLPAVKERLATAGVEPNRMTAEAYGALLRAEHAKWSKVITDAKIRTE